MKSRNRRKKSSSSSTSGVVASSSSSSSSSSSAPAGENKLPFSSIFAPPSPSAGSPATQRKNLPRISTTSASSPPKNNKSKSSSPSSPSMTIRGDVCVKDEKGKEISRLEGGNEMQVENERTILIKNVKGINIVKISKGDTWIKNHGIEEKVSVGNNRVTIANADGILMVEVKDGEISVQDFDGEVIVKNMENVKE